MARAKTDIPKIKQRLWESGLFGHFWALLAEIGRSGGNSPRFPYIQGEVYKTDTKTLLQFT